MASVGKHIPKFSHARPRSAQDNGISLWKSALGLGGVALAVSMVARKAGRPAPKTMYDIYVAELQEFRDADIQFEPLIAELAEGADAPALREILQGYARQVTAQRTQTEQVMMSLHVPPEHQDQAMKSLAQETRKMLKGSKQSPLRDAALIASVQRILHYRIATLGTLAAYARVLGWLDVAGTLASFADAGKNVDESLTKIARDEVNPRAAEYKA